MENKILNFLERNSFGALQLNMNDVFVWGCADCETIFIKEEVPSLIELEEEIGTEATIAWVAILRGYDASNYIKHSSEINFDIKKYTKAKDIIKTNMNKYYYVEFREVADEEEGKIFNKEYRDKLEKWFEDPKVEATRA